MGFTPLEKFALAGATLRFTIAPADSVAVIVLAFGGVYFKVVAALFLLRAPLNWGVFANFALLAGIPGFMVWMALTADAEEIMALIPPPRHMCRWPRILLPGLRSATGAEPWQHLAQSDAPLARPRPRTSPRCRRPGTGTVPGVALPRKATGKAYLATTSALPDANS